MRFSKHSRRIHTDPARDVTSVLKGHPDIRAVRVGEYRAIYEVVGTEVWFTKFGHRSTVYSP